MASVYDNWVLHSYASIQKSLTSDSIHNSWMLIWSVKFLMKVP